MFWLAARRGALCAAALGLCIAVALCGCSAIAEYLGGAKTASPTVSAGSTVAPEPAATQPAMAPTPTTPMAVAPTAASPSPTKALSSPPADAAALGLVYARGTSVLQTGYLGGETREIAAIPPYDTWALDAGRLALALGPAVEVIDLARGSQVSLRVESNDEIEFAEVFWGESGETLLHAAVVADGEAPTFGRRVELRALKAEDGGELGLVVVSDIAGVTIRRYDDAAGTVSFIPRGGDPSFVEVRVVDIQDGSTVATYTVQGEGEAALASDGRRLLVSSSPGGATRLVVHDLVGGASRTGPEVPGMAPVWSPDGLQVAFLSWQGADPARHLDLHVLDVETMQARTVLPVLGTFSSLAGWTPDGSHIVGYQRGEGDGVEYNAVVLNAAYVFAVRPDGGDRRILNLGADAQVLGWMPMVTADTVRLAVDPWPARFAQAQQDPTALAAVVAEYVAAHADRPDEALSAALGERLAAAGWQPDLGGPRVRRIEEGLYVAQLPPLQICLLEAGRAQRVASGHLVMDARREGDALGLIYGAIGASSVQPGFVLLGRQDDGTWMPRWSPQGQRDWIATDGEIRFEGEGLGALRVSGTSFGIDLGEADAFTECHACPHRSLAATWVREGEGYARRTALPADAVLPRAIWEMTVPGPYAVLHEALRRARAGEDVGDLATTDALVDLDALGLMAPGVRLLPEDGQAELGSRPALLAQERDGVVWFSGEGGARYRATVRDGRLVDVTAEKG